MEPLMTDGQKYMHMTK